MSRFAKSKEVCCAFKNRFCVPVGLDQLFPAGRQDDDALSDALRVPEKFIETNCRHRKLVIWTKRRGPGRITVSGFIEPFDQIADLLEFD